MATKHLHALDGLRGAAALAVVIYHWKHFSDGHDGPIPGDQAVLPLPGVLWPLYEYGPWATTLFFSLSGFIFFWLYADRVADRRVSVREFFWLRFSRLYPLHLVTLLAVAAGQITWHATTGRYFVYSQNDVRHFALQLAMASNWSGFEDYSFNAPIWSVSVEVVLYAMFFALFFLRLRRWWWAGVLCAAAVVVPASRPHLADGVAAFFAGGIAYRVYAAVRPGRWLWAMTLAVAVLWVVVPWAVTAGTVPGRSGGLPVGSPDAGGNAATWAAIQVTHFAPHVLLFPATVLVVAWWDGRLTGERRWLARLGQISYSSYLLHFPVQMAFAGATDAAGLSREVYRSPAMLVLFLAVLIPLSFASFHYLELPAQKWLRAKMPVRYSQRKVAAEPAVAPAPAGAG